MSSGAARILACILLTALTFGCKKTGAAGSAEVRPVPVMAVEVVKKPMPLVVRAIGNVRSSASVSLKPRVGGLISSVDFREGQEVQAGDVLLTLDAAPFEVALAQAEAGLAQSREQAENAGQQAARYSSLGKTGVLAKEQIDLVASTARASTAGQQMAEAAVKEAAIQLGYCQIRSPISGRAGRRMIDAGNVVAANTTELVVINQITPIEILFSIPEQHLRDLARYMAQGPLKVQATPAGRRNQPVIGEVTFFDNTVKATTGMVEIKAAFPNEDRVLWPGQFAEVLLTLFTDPEAIVVPAPAVQSGQNGQYVFVVKEDKSVEMRPIELARTLNEEVVIRKGLAAGETVVVDGHLRLTPGAKVSIKPPPAAPR